MSVFFTRRGAVPNLPKLASDYTVGESVFLNVNGVSTEFLVVHQGKPSSLYDSSCDGTWLLSKDICTLKTWDSSNNDYKNSDIHSYVVNSFVELLDATSQSAIKQVKIPYVNGTGSSGSVASGANGLSCKAFLLGAYELGATTTNDSYFPVDGACLDYFNGLAQQDSKRIAYMNGTIYYWWLRSPYKSASTHSCCVNSNGEVTRNYATNNYGVRPSLILNSTTKFDPNTNMIL